MITILMIMHLLAQAPAPSREPCRANQQEECQPAGELRDFKNKDEDTPKIERMR